MSKSKTKTLKEMDSRVYTTRNGKKTVSYVCGCCHYEGPGFRYFDDTTPKDDPAKDLCECPKCKFGMFVL